MTSSEDISRAFYAALGVKGLEARTRPEWDAQILAALEEMIPAGSRVLDLGCGYGRIAVPLAKSGFEVTGADISANLIAEARLRAEEAGVYLELIQASMTALPFPAGDFDVVLCLWSAFHELLHEAEQVAAVAEMSRVLAPGGFGLVEGPRYSPPTDEEVKSGKRRGPGGRWLWDMIQGELNAHFVHDDASLARVCELAGVERFATYEREWAGRRRLLLRLDRAVR